MSRSRLIVLLLVLSACARSEWAIPEGFTTESAMGDAIRRVIPAGTSITDAQARMEASGFGCVYQWHGPYGNEQNLNYLYCHREEGGWMAPRTWQVAIAMNGVTVGDIRIATGLVGPS